MGIVFAGWVSEDVCSALSSALILAFPLPQVISFIIGEAIPFFNDLLALISSVRLLRSHRRTRSRTDLRLVAALRLVVRLHPLGFRLL